MRALSSADFLDLWERGSRLHPVDQGLLALSAALPGHTCDTLADWPLGRRNQALAELRCSCFGPALQGWVACPAMRRKAGVRNRTPAPSPGRCRRGSAPRGACRR